MSNGGAQHWSHQFIDSSGNPYSGVKVYHTAAGTDTLKNVWTDEGKVTPAANPVVGDSRGVVSFYADGDYKFVIKDANDVILYTWDNIKITSDTATMWEGNIGTAYPSVTANNLWQQFGLKDASNNFLGLALNTGTEFVPFTPGVWSNDSDASAVANKTMILSSTVTLTANTVIPASVSIMPINPGVIVSNGYTLTINGPVVGDPRHQWLSGFASGDVTFGVGTIDWAYAEWWGAVAVGYSTTANDCATEIQCAISSGADVKLLKGKYGFGSGLSMSKDGQTLLGSGRYVLADNNGGTILIRKSGFSGVGLTVGPFVGQVLGNFVLDGGSIDGGVNGNLLKMNVSQYPTVENMRIINCGGDDAAMVVASVSIGSFKNIDFAGNYANLYCANEIYGVIDTHFDNISLGTCTDTTQFGLYIYGGEGLTFTKLYANSRLKIYGDITTPVDAITFNDLYTEFETTSVGASPQIVIEGSAGGYAKNIKINGHKHIQNDAITQLFMDIKNVYGFEYNNLNFQDNGSIAGRDLIRLDGLLLGKFENIQVYNTSANAADLITSIGTRSDDIIMTNIMGTGGTVLTCDWKATRLKLENIGSSVNHTFQVGTGSVSLTNVTGTVTETNIGEVEGDLMGTYTVLTLPDVNMKRKLIYVSNEVGGAVIAFSDGTNWRRVTDRAIVS